MSLNTDPANRYWHEYYLDMARLEDEGAHMLKAH
jgi:hypothetical protein